MTTKSTHHCSFAGIVELMDTPRTLRGSSISIAATLQGPPWTMYHPGFADHRRYSYRMCGLWFVVCGLRSAAYGLLLNTLCCLLGGFKFRIATLSALCSCFFLSLSRLSVNFLSLFPCVLKIPVYCTHNMSAGTNQLWPSNVRGSVCSTWIIVFR